MISGLKRLFLVVAALNCSVLAVKPPNYIEKPKVPDKYPPKYEYNYFIANRHNQAAQGHKEIRNGDNTAGNYFVNLPKGESKTIVNYIADDWGFFPITRYSSSGPHHRVSGHFALGQHAVERLNQTTLNTNEVFSQLLEKNLNQKFVKQQEQADASFATPQIAFDTKHLPVTFDNVRQHQTGAFNTKLYPLPLQQEQIQLMPTSNPSMIFNHALPQFHKHEKQQTPLFYHHPQQIPLIYQYAQQNAPQLNYFHQQQKPQEIIYHHQPIASMTDLKSHQPVISLLPTAVGSISHVTPTIGANLLNVQTTPSSVATENQQNAKIRDDAEKLEEAQFEAPIVVNDERDETVIVKQNTNLKFFDNFHQQKQINVQILADNLQLQSSTPKVTNSNNYQYLVEDKDQDILGSTPSTIKEAPSRQFLRNFKKYQSAEYSTTAQSFSTTASTSSCCKDVPITPRPIPNAILAPVHVGIRLSNEKLDDCIDGHAADKKTIVEVRKNVKAVITKKPSFGDRIVFSTPSAIVTQPHFIETAQPTAQILIEKESPAVFHQPIVVEKEVPVDRPIFINSLPQTKIVDRPVYIQSPLQTKVVDRPVYIQSPPQIIEKIVHQPTFKTVEKPIFIEKIVKQPVTVEKIVDRPVYIQSPPETKIIHEPVIVEKAVIKEIKVPVEKTVFIKSPPETKIVHQPVYQTVEKPVFIEKIVKQPFEVEKIVEKFIDRPVDRIVEKPVIHTVEKIVEKPIFQTVEKPVYIEKIVDRPVDRIIDRPVFQTVEKIVEKPVFQTVEKIVEKPVFHTVEKPVYIEKFIDRPVEKIVEKPVIQTIEKIVEKPVIQTVEKFIERPYPVPYAVPFEKHVYHKPDFHVIAKSIPNKHKLFDFESLFGFLTKKEEVKHIYVPSSPQYQLNQLNKHQLAYSTIEPIKESPVFDYGRYATSHLGSIKPVYGVPSSSTLLRPIGSGYSNPDPYTGSYAAYSSNQGVASIPSTWLADSIPAQSQTTTIHKDNYVGPTPNNEDYWAVNVATKDGVKFRRNVENGRSLRIEYGGFYPKINPSVEIDQNGTPIKKEGSET